MGDARVSGGLRRVLVMRLRAALRDLFDEGVSPTDMAGGAWAGEAQALLAAADTQLAELRQAWAAGLARSHRAEQDWQAAGQAAARQDAAVDQALRAGQDRAAWAMQRELNLGQGRLAALEQRRRAEAALVADLAQAIRSLEAQIGAARFTTDAAVAWGHTAAAQAQLAALQLTLTRLADRPGAGKDGWA